MDSLEVNKACAAVLVAGITFMLAGLVGETLVHPRRLETTAIKIDVPDTGGPRSGRGRRSADRRRVGVRRPALGESLVKQQGCVACHSFNEGGRNGIGPNLYGVVGGPHGHIAGFDYSASLKSKQGPWTYDELYAWLRSPAPTPPAPR